SYTSAMVFFDTPCSAAPARTERRRSPGFSRPCSIHCSMRATSCSTRVPGAAWSVTLVPQGQLVELSHRLCLVRLRIAPLGCERWTVAEPSAAIGREPEPWRRPMTATNRARRATLKTALAAGAAGASLAAPAIVRAQESVTWRMQALWDGGTTPQKFEEKFVARIAELTGGRFKINLFSAGQIVPAAQAFDAVRGGAFELMKTFDGYEAGKIPAFAFTSTIPFGFAESDQYEAWFYERGGLDFAREAYGAAGLYYIAPTVYGQEPLHSKVPIKSIADLQGKKGRFVGLASSVMGALGVSVTPLPTGEVYTALDKGMIDMADRGDLTANFEAGLAEVAKYVILPGFHQPTTA